MLSPDELRALEVMIDRRIGDALRSGIDTARVVDAVNADGTVNLRVGDSVVPAVSALASYSPRAAGDTVLTRVRAGEQVVIGKAGPAVTIPEGLALTISNTAAPGGAGWQEVVTGQLWAKAGALWCKRTVSDPGTTAGSVARVGALRTYRGGSVSQIGVAEQGYYAGQQAGLAHFGGSWTAALTGKTVTGGTLVLHRQNAGGIYGAVPVVIFRAMLGATIPETTPTYLADARSISLARNQTGTLTLDAAWCDAFRAGTADALVLWTDDTSQAGNAQCDRIDLTITYA
jgi:hypothetical protein